MSIESFKPANWPSKTEARPTENNDSALFRDAKNKIEILNSFLATGDIISDYNYFLEITQRRINYKRATTESKEELINNLKNIQAFLLEEQKSRTIESYEKEDKKMFYQELPQTEIGVLTELIDFYK